MATQATKARPITVEQYEHFKGYPGLRDELIYGEIVMSPQAKPLHQQIAENIKRAIERLLSGSPFVVKQDTNIKFVEANSMPSPDVFVIPRKAWREACERDEYLATPPLVAIEVVSPSNRKARVEQKADLYLDQGVAQVWVIYPKKQLTRVYQAVDGNRHVSDVPCTGTLPLPAPLEGGVNAADIFTFD